MSQPEEPDPPRRARTPEVPPGGWSVPIGTLCGSFRIVRPIGFGGMGEVYEAVHVSMPARRVAVKFLLLRADPRDYVDRFLEETEVLFRVNHPNVVRLYDAGFMEDPKAPGGRRPWMAMELLQGGTLADVLNPKRPRLEPHVMLRVLSEIAAGLGAAHALGVIHRDLKPSNVFVTSKGAIKVIDYGTSKILHADETEFTKRKSTEPSRLLGTDVFMSPEQLTGKDLDPRSDMFPLGIIGYMAVSGEHPFFARRGPRPATPELIFKICWLEPTPLGDVVPGLSKPVASLVMRLLAKSPEQRYRNMHEVMTECFDILEEEAPGRDGSRVSYATMTSHTDDVPKPPLQSPSLAPPAARPSLAGQLETEPMVPQMKASEIARRAAAPARGKNGTELMLAHVDRSERPRAGAAVAARAAEAAPTPAAARLPAARSGEERVLARLKIAVAVVFALAALMFAVGLKQRRLPDKEGQRRPEPSAPTATALAAPAPVAVAPVTPPASSAPTGTPTPVAPPPSPATAPVAPKKPQSAPTAAARRTPGGFVDPWAPDVSTSPAVPAPRPSPAPSSSSHGPPFERMF